MSGMYFVVKDAIEKINDSKLGYVERDKMVKLILSAFINDDQATINAVLQVLE